MKNSITAALVLTVASLAAPAAQAYTKISARKTFTLPGVGYDNVLKLPKTSCEIRVESGIICSFGGGGAADLEITPGGEYSTFRVRKREFFQYGSPQNSTLTDENATPIQPGWRYLVSAKPVSADPHMEFMGTFVIDCPSSENAKDFTRAQWAELGEYLEFR